MNSEPEGKKQRHNFLIIFLMNITVFPMIFAWTVLGIMLCPVVFLLLRIFTDRDTGRIIRLLIWLYGRGWLVIVLPFVKFSTEGLKKDFVKQPCIFVINHLSFFDTYCMALLPVSDIIFTVRSWPFSRLFWFTPFMRLAGYLDVENEKWDQVSITGKKNLSQGSALLFFPEGHRSRNGQLQRFFSGAFKLAAESKTPVVPLCITGTDSLFPPGRFWFEPAQICLRALQPVYPESFDGASVHTRMRISVKKTMEENILEMRDNEQTVFSKH